MINTFQIIAHEPVHLTDLNKFLQLGDQFLLKHGLPSTFLSPISLEISLISSGTQVKMRNEINISFDLNEDYRRLFQEVNKAPNKKYPLYRALKKFNIPSTQGKVVDCTAGFLGDSLLMLIFQPSIEIMAFESNALLFILLYHSLLKSTYAQLDQLQLIYGSSLDYLQQNTGHLQEIFYCDPMFEVKSQKSKNKKKIQFLEELIQNKNQLEFLPLLKGRNYIFKTSSMNQLDEREYPTHFKEVGKNIIYYIFIAN